MPSLELLFQKMINDTKFLGSKRYYGFYHPLYKYTIELLFDGYMIPDKYLVVKNRVLREYHKIYKILGRRGDLELIIKLFKLNNGHLSYNNLLSVSSGAASAGKIHVLEWISIHDNLPGFMTAYAAKDNQLKTLLWLIDHSRYVGNLTLKYAVENGHMDIIRFLIDNKKYNFNYCGVANRAASKGHIDAVTLLYSIDPHSLNSVWRCNIDVLNFICDNDLCSLISPMRFSCVDVNVLKLLFENDHLKINDYWAANIAERGNLECLKYLYSKHFPIFNVAVAAVKSGNVEMLEWLHSIGISFNGTFGAAIEIGSIIILKLLLLWNYDLPENIYSTAIYYGDLDILQLFYDHGCVLYGTEIQIAASCGHLHIIIWLLERGCKLNADICYNTVKDGHIDVLRWLRGFDRDICSKEYGICDWDDRVYIDAIEFDRVDILEFALKNGCPFDETCYRLACESENNNIVACAEKYYSFD